MRIRIEKGVESKKKRAPLDFERGACYAFYAILSCDIHCQIENRKQGRKGLKKLAKMVKISGMMNKNMEKLIDMMEDNDDVQNIYHNWEND